MSCKSSFTGTQSCLRSRSCRSSAEHTKRFPEGHKASPLKAVGRMSLMHADAPAASITSSPADSRLGSKEFVPRTPSTSASTPSGDVGAPVDCDQLSQLLEACGDRVATARRLSCTGQDAFDAANVVTWTQIINQQSIERSQARNLPAAPKGPWEKARGATLPRPCVELGSTRRESFFNPVTMQEMLMLPRPKSPEKEPLAQQETKDDHSPLKAFMISRGAFPGSAHIVEGENADLLMSNWY